MIIAGNISHLPNEIAYYKSEIEPFIDDVQIKYVGPLNDEKKNYYLGKSSVLLMLVDIDEAFGMVMAEAMACGTPVIGFPRGGVPEVIEENVTGFVVKSVDEVILALEKISKINRSLCRESAMKRFNVDVVAKSYLGIFEN